MSKIPKKRKAVLDKVDLEKHYTVLEAMDVVKKVTTTKFDASVDLDIRLGVDPKQADQALRGTVVLPHGTGKTKRVIVFCTSDKEEEAKGAGADHVGLDDLVEKIQGGWLDFDVAVAMPSVMSKIGRIARVLGPRGLMPNPKTGTVTMDLAKAVNEVKGGKIAFRVDKFGIVHSPVGRASFSPEKLNENAMELISTLVKMKPSSAKGIYVKSITASSTMSPGVKIDTKSIK